MSTIELIGKLMVCAWCWALLYAATVVATTPHRDRLERERRIEYARANRRVVGDVVFYNQEEDS